MTVLSVNSHCFQTGLRQPYNHIIARTKPSAKPLLSAAWVISDTCHFHFTRALCHIFPTPYVNTAFHQTTQKNAPPWGRKPSHNLDTANQMLGDTTRRNFQFRQKTSTGAPVDPLKYDFAQRGPAITGGCLEPPCEMKALFLPVRCKWWGDRFSPPWMKWGHSFPV